MIPERISTMITAKFVLQKGIRVEPEFEQATLEERSYSTEANVVQLSIQQKDKIIGSFQIRQHKGGIEVYVPSIPDSKIIPGGEGHFCIHYDE